MGWLVADILTLPEAEQLPAALDALRDLTGEEPGQVAWAMQTLGLTPKLARLFLTLNAAAPGWVPTSRLAYLHAGESAGGVRYVDLFVMKLRRRGVPGRNDVWIQAVACES